MERARHHRRQTAHHAGWPSEAFKKRKGNFSTLTLEIIVIVEFSLHILRMPISVIWPRPKLHFVRLRKLYLLTLETCPFILSWLWKWFWALWSTFGHFHFLFKLDFHRFHNLFHFFVICFQISILISNVWTFWRFWIWQKKLRFTEFTQVFVLLTVCWLTKKNWHFKRKICGSMLFLVEWWCFRFPTQN